MLRINWVDPDTLRYTDRVTGTVSIAGQGVDVTIELFGHQEYPVEFLDYIQLALILLNVAQIHLPSRFQEPEPEPELGPLNTFLPEPEPAPYTLEELNEFQ